MVRFLIQIIRDINKEFGKTFLYEKMEDLITILPSINLQNLGSQG